MNIYQTKTDSWTSRTDLQLPRGKKGLRVGISRCRLLYRERINKILLNSTRHYIQYPVTSHNGEEYKKE